jgi:lysophospholipase L1-like esterase
VIIPRDAQIHPELYQMQVNELLKRYGTLGDTVWDLEAPDKAILEFMNKHTIPTLDLMPGFQAYAQTHDDLLYFKQDIHFTDQGHRLAAELMCDWLIEDGLVPR